MRGERQHRHGLHRRRDARRATLGRVRHARRRVRPRLRARSGARRRARQHRSATAVLGRGRLQPRQRAVRLVRAAGVAAAGAAPPVRVAARQPAGLAQAAALAPGAVRPRRRRVPEQPRARRAAGHVRALRGLSLRLGRAARSASRSRSIGVFSASCRADWSARSCAASANDACCSRALACGAAGLRRLRARAHRDPVHGGRADRRAVGPRLARRARADDAAHRTHRAGRIAGRQGQRARHRDDDRSEPVRQARSRIPSARARACISRARPICWRHCCWPQVRCSRRGSTAK